MLCNDYQRDWPAYFDAVENQPPRQTLLFALDHLAHVDHSQQSHPLLLDIACGSGRDTLAVLSTRPHWHALSTDTSTQGLSRLHARARAAQVESRLVTAMVSMEELPAWWTHRASATHTSQQPTLINASFALPFCEPARFPALWSWMLGTLAPGGCLACQLFGDRDEWASIRPQSHHTREQARALLAPLELLMFDEVEKDGSDAMGSTKHHHLFHIVARKPEKAASPA
jgi:SAM-dependent methyltransferase